MVGKESSKTKRHSQKQESTMQTNEDDEEGREREHECNKQKQ